MLLPTDDTAIRRKLDQWLQKHGVRPMMLGEYEDYALLREFARAGHGFAPVPSLLEEQFRRDGMVRVGAADGVRRGILRDLGRTSDPQSRRGGDDRKDPHAPQRQLSMRLLAIVLLPFIGSLCAAFLPRAARNAAACSPDRWRLPVQR